MLGRHSVLRSVALRVTGVRANGYKNGYTFEKALGRGGWGVCQGVLARSWPLRQVCGGGQGDEQSRPDLKRGISGRSKLQSILIGHYSSATVQLRDLALRPFPSRMLLCPNITGDSTGTTCYGNGFNCSKVSFAFQFVGRFCTHPLYTTGIGRTPWPPIPAFAVTVPSDWNPEAAFFVVKSTLPAMMALLPFPPPVGSGSTTISRLENLLETKA